MTAPRIQATLFAFKNTDKTIITICADIVPPDVGASPWCQYFDLRGEPFWVNWDEVTIAQEAELEWDGEQWAMVTAAASPESMREWDEDTILWVVEPEEAG